MIEGFTWIVEVFAKIARNKLSGGKNRGIARRTGNLRPRVRTCRISQIALGQICPAPNNKCPTFGKEGGVIRVNFEYERITLTMLARQEIAKTGVPSLSVVALDEQNLIII